MSSQQVEKGGDSFSAASYVRSAFEILVKGAPDVAQSLLDLATSAKSEYVRVQAAQAILSRIGLPEKVDVGITAVHLVGDASVGSTGMSAADLVKERLKVLHAVPNLDDDGIVEGEVVEDGPEAEVYQLFPLHPTDAGDDD